MILCSSLDRIFYPCSSRIWLMLRPGWSNSVICIELKGFFRLGTSYTWDFNLTNNNLWPIKPPINSPLNSLVLLRSSKGLVGLLIGWTFLLVPLFTHYSMFLAWRLSWATGLSHLLFYLLSIPKVFLPLNLWQFCRPGHSIWARVLLLSYWYNGMGVPLRMLPGRIFWHFNNSFHILWPRCSIWGGRGGGVVRSPSTITMIVLLILRGISHWYRVI